MNVMELGAIGELVGGVAVIASLIYLAVQVRQGNREARSESIRELATEMGRISMRLSDPGLSEAVRKAINHYDVLSRNEQCVAAGWLGGLFTCAQATFAVRRSGRPSQIEHFCAAWIAAPGLRPWWQAAQINFSNGFVAEVERLADSAEPVDDRCPWFALDAGEAKGA